MKKKIFVVGSYGAGNVGDEAIFSAINSNLGEDFEIVLSIPHLPLSFFKIPFRLKTLKALKNSDVVLLGGGGLFTDSDDIKAIKIWGSAIEWARFYNKPIFVYANSVGPFYSKKASDLTKKYLSKVDKITVRDDISYNTLKKMGLSSKTYSDPVFSYKFLRKGGGVKKVMAVSLRGLNKEEFNHLEFEKYLSMKEKMGYKILFVFMDDKDVKIFDKYYKKEGRFGVKPKNFDELLEILENCETCIGMRLHFLIASALLGKRMLAISYSTKIEGIMDKIGIESIEVNKKDFENIEKKFNFPKDIDKQIKKVEELDNDFRRFVEKIH